MYKNGFSVSQALYWTLTSCADVLEVFMYFVENFWFQTKVFSSWKILFVSSSEIRNFFYFSLTCSDALYTFLLFFRHFSSAIPKDSLKKTFSRTIHKLFGKEFSFFSESQKNKRIAFKYIKVGKISGTFFCLGNEDSKFFSFICNFFFSFSKETSNVFVRDSSMK